MRADRAEGAFWSHAREQALLEMPLHTEWAMSSHAFCISFLALSLRNLLCLQLCGPQRPLPDLSDIPCEGLGAAADGPFVCRKLLSDTERVLSRYGSATLRPHG